jgi:hypothetical protein
MTVGIENYGCAGTLTIGTVLLNCPAWDIPDLSPLWIEAAQRGRDRIIPGVAGVLAYRRRLDVTTHALRILISGDVEPDGTPYADAVIGLELNVELLRSSVVDPTNVGDGTRAATLTMPSGATRTADVHVTGLRVSSTRADPHHRHALLVGALQVSIPTGRFA